MSACQLGITLASLGLGWVGEPTIGSLIHPVLEKLHFSPVAISTVSFIIAFSVITIFHIVLGELVTEELCDSQGGSCDALDGAAAYCLSQIDVPVHLSVERNSQLDAEANWH